MNTEKISCTDEEIAYVKNLSLSQLASSLVYTVVKTRAYYHLKEMDSLVIYNDRTWNRWSGKGNNRLVAACKFWPDNVVHYMFSEIKTTMEPEFINSHGSASDGTSGNLDEIIETVENYPILKDLPQIKERFLHMFIVDALIGNNDRNNGNWGILVYKDHIDMIPIYDNGRLCFHSINGKKINPYHYIMKMENEDCNKAVEHIFPNISLDKINDIIEDVYKAGLLSVKTL